MNNFFSDQNNVLLQTEFVEASDLQMKNKHFVNTAFDSQYTHTSSDFVGNKAKRRISKRVFQENKARQIFRKTNIYYPWYVQVRVRTRR